MLPVPSAGIGPVEFPTLPPRASGPNPSGPFAFGQLYDRMQTVADAGRTGGLPMPMEVPPIIAPAASLDEPFQASPEFPGAVRPDAQTARPADPIGSLLAPLGDGLKQVNAMQFQSKDLQNEAAVGGDVDLHDVMITAEKASVAMQLTLQIRNKMVEAYQEVMRMQV